jgi:hypothetical protein
MRAYSLPYELSQRQVEAGRRTELEKNPVRAITPEAVEAARQSLVIGPV